MGIEWMNKSEINEAIPPAYAEFVGRELLRHMDFFRDPIKVLVNA